MGVEPDVTAVETARARGADVRLGGIEVIADREGEFDMVSLRHVVEHVHEPADLLRACHGLLRPGGYLWIETPNLDSLGHRIYGQAWRDLDPPRHLVVFTGHSMMRALREAGFGRIEVQPFRPLCAFVFTASEAIQHGRDPKSDARLSALGHWRAFRADRDARAHPERREFLTLKAWKEA